MSRTVKVELTADVASYISEVLEADKATDKLDKKVEALGHDLDKLPAEAAVAAAGLAGLDEAAKKTGTGVEELGKKTRTSTDETGKLDQRIAELKTSTRSLAEEFNRTGDTSLLKKFRADSSELAGLTKMRKEFGGLADDAKKVISPLEQITKDAEKFSKEAEQGAMSFGDLASPAMIGGIAALVPPALALAGALTIVGAAAGIAGAGIAGAVAGNPAAFKAEWATTIGEIKKDWIDASQPFVGPTLAAIRSIGPMVASWHIDAMFQKAATFVEPLVHGVEGFVTGVEKGVAALVDKAGPEIKVLEADLPKLGDAVGTAFKMIAANAEGGAQSLNDFVVALEKIVIATGALISGAEAMGGALTTVNADVKHFLDAIPSWVYVIDPLLTIPRKLADVFTPEPFDATAGAAGRLGAALAGIGASTNAAGLDFTTLQQKLTATKVDADSLAETMSLKVLDTTMSLDQATLHFDESLTKVGESLKANGKTLDWHTAKGQANVSAILASVQANISAYKANVDAGMGAEAAASAYDANTRALEKQLRQSGLTQASIDQLIGKYRGVPKKVDTDIAINGLTDAINNLGDLIAQINGIAGHNYHSTVTIDYIENRKSVYSNQVPSYSNNTPTAPHGATPHAAGGMLSPGWNLLGEEGPELVRDGMVYPTGQTRSLMAASRPWSGGDAAVAVSFDVSPAANMTWLGAIVNEGIRNGYVVVKASQVRQNA